MTARRDLVRPQEPLVSSLESRIEPLEPDWEGLAERIGASPFLRPTWIGLWWRAFGAGELEILAVRRASRLVGVVPLARRWGSLRGLANWHTPEFGFLAEDRTVSRALARSLVARVRWWGAVSFVDSGRDDLRGLHSAARERGYRTWSRTLERSPYVVTEGEWETYWRGRSKNLRRGLERGRRALGDGLSYDLATGDDGLDDRLAEILRLEAAGWKARRGTAIVSRPRTEAFYTEVARWAARRGWLRFLSLRLGDRTIAMQLALEHDGVLYLLKGGFDPAYAKFSPGNLLLRATLERAFSADVHRCELLGDAEPYKLAWTEACRDMVALHAFAPSALGRLAWSAMAYGRPAAKRAGLAPIVHRLRR
ncbi:MAG TPA: GNAT family N-acetyltransferase [Gaiellaceae bacterium]